MKEIGPQKGSEIIMEHGEGVVWLRRADLETKEFRPIISIIVDESHVEEELEPIALTFIQIEHVAEVRLQRTVVPQPYYCGQEELVKEYAFNISSSVSPEQKLLDRIFRERNRDSGTQPPSPRAELPQEIWGTLAPSIVIGLHMATQFTADSAARAYIGEASKTVLRSFIRKTNLFLSKERKNERAVLELPLEDDIVMTIKLPKSLSEKKRREKLGRAYWFAAKYIKKLSN